MKGIIQYLLRESLLSEIGDSQVLPYQLMEQNDHLERGVPILDEIVYLFNVKSERILVHFKLERTRTQNKKKVFDYSIVFTIDGGYSKANDMSTLLPKMVTIFGGIIPEFFSIFSKQYVTPKTDFGMLYFYGIGDDDKGEDVTSDEETKRTKLYSYFIKKFTPPEYTSHQTGNTFYYTKN